MSQMGRNVIKLVALVFVAAVVVGITEVAVEATPGDIRRTVHIPAAAQCGGGEIPDPGSALAIMSGGKVGFLNIPVLLVTSAVGTVPPGGGRLRPGSNIYLFFLNPFDPAQPLNGDGSYNATLVKPILTAFPPSPPTNSLPDFGWEALVYRPDRADLLACGTNTAAGKTVLWSLDFSPFNTTPDGTATFLGNGPSGSQASSCNAIAWDASDKTIYQTPATGANVLHFTLTGTTATSITTIPSGCTTPISGIGIAGTSLFVGCQTETDGELTITPSTIRQVPKGGGNLVRTLSPEGLPDFPAGLPDDPTTLATEYKELLWILDESFAVLTGVEIPGGTFGQIKGPPEPFPGVGDPDPEENSASCPQITPGGAYASTSGDALLDCWKIPWSDGLPGISYRGNYGTRTTLTDRDVVLCDDGLPPLPNRSQADINAHCAVSTSQKYLLVEADYMVGDLTKGQTFHKPDLTTVITPVVQAFANAPTLIRLLVQLGDAIQHNDTTAFVPCTVPANLTVNPPEADFDSLKKDNFGTPTERANPNGQNAKALAFRYGLFVHKLSPSPANPTSINKSSGCSEIGGNDFIVSLGTFETALFGKVSHQVGNIDKQKSTFMHELGHTLDLRHGGGDNINCKPNYPSVMNYYYQFSSPVNPRPLKFSEQEVGNITTPGGVKAVDKNDLNELLGVGGFNGQIAFGPPVKSGLLSALAPVVLSAAGAIDWNRINGATQSGVIRDINQSIDGGCPARQDQFGLTGNDQTEVRVLEGFNDLAHIKFDFRGNFDFGAGNRAVEELGGREMTQPQALAMSRDVIDIKPGDPNNTISRNAGPTINVAIFSRNDDSVPPQRQLDATQIDPATLHLKGDDPFTWDITVKKNPNEKFQCHTEDVDHDGLLDFVCGFDMPKNTLSSGETKALLEGMTFGGQPVNSSDSIRVVP